MHGIWSKKLALKILFIGIGIGLLLNHYFTRINHSKYKVLNSQPKKLIVKDKNLDLPTHDLYLGPDFPKRDAVKSAFKHAWFAYERDAWGSDEYHPISQSGSNLSNSAGIGYTIIDSLDTIQLMGLTDEYARARNWIENELSFDVDDKFNTFETTIRVLGGLLSSYYLSSNPFSQNLSNPDPLYLNLAADLGERLVSSFDQDSGLPLSFVNLHRMEGISDQDNRGFISTAEAASLQLEFKYLSQLLDDSLFWRKSEGVMQLIKDAPKRDGLVPIFIDLHNNSPHVKNFYFSSIRLGSRADSYYEYLLKQYLQTASTEHVYKDIPEYRPYNKQDHLVCFLPGLFLLGVHEGKSHLPLDQSTFTTQQREDWWVGEELLKTCYDTYTSTKSGLSPEIIHFHQVGDYRGQKEDWYIKPSRGEDTIDGRYILRPETVESIFIAFRLSGNNKYREWGWSIFESIEKHAKINSGGYASIMNVNKVPVDHEDKMETFLLSETFKYLYLLFEDNSVAPLDKVVFNTEAHILPIFKPSFQTNVI
ncbi:hypothetical protein E3P91_03834 [Wallemia ichthyophaga]|nr:hypothetical protein E3P91_03834 [Wallemia ichthyophaga]TIB58631.1 hypothetical protein E3P78_03842 [Wallemia ichthyophaga]